MTWRFGQPVSFETEHYAMRSLGPDDVTDTYLSWFEDEEVMEHAGLPPGMNAERHRQYLRKFDNVTLFDLGIFAKETGEMIGFIMVFLDPYNRIARTAATIGDKAFWGKEVVLECRAAVLGFLFDEMGVHKVWGRVNTRNIPSVFNYKAQGFVCEGVMREHGRKPDGSRVDQYLFGLLRKDWVAAKAAVAKNG